MIYLDNAATTKMFEEGVDIYKKYACYSFFNPSAGYNQSLEISNELQKTREALLKKLGAKTGNIIFTSCATESNNFAIMGSKRNGKWEYVFSIGEHPSVYRTAKELEMQGYVVHFVNLNENGEIDYEHLKTLLNEKTRLVSVMHVSNETGAINDLKRINEIRMQYAPKALLHVDGVQAFCKLKYNIDDYKIDLYTVSAHKFHGPKGVGALYVRNIQSIKSLLFGGEQEFGLRAGTENVGGIKAMEYAFNHIDVESNFQKVSKLYNIFANNFEKNERIHILKTNNPYIMSVEFEGINGETLMRILQDNEILVGMGSACSTKKMGNRILENMGYSKEQVKAHIRISLDASLTEDECEFASKEIVRLYNDLWERIK